MQLLSFYSVLQDQLCEFCWWNVQDRSKIVNASLEYYRVVLVRSVLQVLSTSICIPPKKHNLSIRS